MRLTNALRARIERAITNDLPQEDIAAVARDELLTATVAALPPKVRAIFKDPDLTDYLNLETIYTNCGNIMVHVPAPRNATRSQSVSDEAFEQFKVRCGELRTQKEKHAAIRREVAAALGSCSNTKVFCERFPDLAKYVPAGATATANLPATTHLMDTLRGAGLKTEDA